MTAARTAFAAGEPAVQLDQLAPGPRRLVLELSDQFAPASIGDGLAQRPIADQVLHRQRLDTDHLVFVDQSARQLMQAIKSGIGNFCVQAGDLLSGFGPVLRAPLLAAQRPLGLGQAGSVLRRVARIARPLPVGGDEQVLQAQVDAGRSWCHRHRLGLDLAEQGNKVAAGVVAGNRHRRRHRRQGFTLLRPADRQRFLALGQEQPAVSESESGGSELGRLVVFFRLEHRVAGALVKEVLEGLLLVPEALLQGYTGHLVQEGLIGLLLQRGQPGAGALVADAYLSLTKRLGAPRQDRVVDEAHAAERPRQQDFLLGRRIEPVAVSTFCLHAETVCISMQRINR